MASRKGRERNREENGSTRENVKSIHRNVFVSRYGVKETNGKSHLEREAEKGMRSIHT